MVWAIISRALQREGKREREDGQCIFAEMDGLGIVEMPSRGCGCGGLLIVGPRTPDVGDFGDRKMA